MMKFHITFETHTITQILKATLCYKILFTVLSLNTQSLPAKFTDITLFIDELRTHNCYVDVINFQETWTTENIYYADFNSSDYTGTFNRLLVLLTAD